MVCRQGAGLIDGGVTVLERWAFLAKMLLAHGRQDDHDVVLSQKAVYNVPFRPKLPKELSLEWWTGDCAIEFLRNRDRSKPFFAHFSFQRPHAPITPPAPYDTMYRRRTFRCRPARVRI